MIVGIDPSFTALGISDGVSHAVLSAPPLEGEERATSTRRRSALLASYVAGWISEHKPIPEPQCFAIDVFIEAPLLSTQGGGANHLYELGWLMAALYVELETSFFGVALSISEVPTSVVRKFVTGKGNTPKSAFPLQVFKRWRIEFPKDRGADQAFAFALQRYGEAVVLGEIEAHVSARRGEGKKERGMKRAIARGAA